LLIIYFLESIFKNYFLKILELLLILLLIMLSASTFIQVFFRYIVNRSLPWPGEFSGFLLVWITYLGSSLALYYNQHISFNLVIKNLTNKYPKVALYLICIYNILLCGLFLLITLYSIPVVQRTWNAPVMAVTFLKKGWVYSVIPISFLIMTIINFLKTIITINNSRLRRPWEYLWREREREEG